MSITTGELIDSMTYLKPPRATVHITINLWGQPTQKDMSAILDPSYSDCYISSQAIQDHHIPPNKPVRFYLEPDRTFPATFLIDDEKTKGHKFALGREIWDKFTSVSRNELAESCSALQYKIEHFGPTAMLHELNDELQILGFRKNVDIRAVRREVDCGLYRLANQSQSLLERGVYYEQDGCMAASFRGSLAPKNPSPKICFTTNRSDQDTTSTWARSYRCLIVFLAFKSAVHTYAKSAVHAAILIDQEDQSNTSLELCDQLRDRNDANILDWSLQKLQPEKAFEHVQELLRFWNPSTATAESSPG